MRHSVLKWAKRAANAAVLPTSKQEKYLSVFKKRDTITTILNTNIYSYSNKYYKEYNRCSCGHSSKHLKKDGCQAVVLLEEETSDQRFRCRCKRFKLSAD